MNPVTSRREIPAGGFQSVTKLTTSPARLKNQFAAESTDTCICICWGMSQSVLSQLPCLCAGLRRSARALTQLYEEALRPLGLRATQFTILQVLATTGELSQSRLAGMLALDVTTLTRTLEIMRRHGWIAGRPGEDRRWHFWRLAKPGESLLARALPVWEKQQSRLRRRLGSRRWQNLLDLATQVTTIVQHQGEKS